MSAILKDNFLVGSFFCSPKRFETSNLLTKELSLQLDQYFHVRKDFNFPYYLQGIFSTGNVENTYRNFL